MRLLLVFVIGLLLLGLCGCAPMEHWGANRVADLMDIGALGVGGTTESKVAGPVPPCLGLLAEVGPMQLGAIGYGGMTAEWENRAIGVYPEKRVRIGLLWGEYSRIDQSEEEGLPYWVSFYKSPESAAWHQRMRWELRWADRPAKDLIHEDRHCRWNWFHMPRGWQYWEYIGMEVGLCDPFLTHLGITLRAGVDVSEFTDFVLGFFCIDFKQDDRRGDE